MNLPLARSPVRNAIFVINIGDGNKGKPRIKVADAPALPDIAAYAPAELRPQDSAFRH